MIKYVSAVVPKASVKNIRNNFFKEDFRERFVETTGIRERRISSHTVEELMIDAVKRLDRIDYSAIVTVTQTPTYQMPGPGFFIARHLEKKDIAIFDLNAACDGYLKGLAMAEMLAMASEQNVLLLVGDTLGSFMPKDSPSVSLVFGNAASATLVTPDPEFSGIMSEAIPEGAGYLTAIDGIPFMNGEAVTHFATREVPRFLKANNLKADLYYFHQANKMILNSIEKRMGLDPKFCPQTYEYFGNTSSASIPLTICMHPPMAEEKTMLLCGFGAGLSISACVRQKPESTIFGEFK